MEQDVVKRNITYFVLSILKTQTDAHNRHLSADEIVHQMKNTYQWEPSKKTVSGAIHDLQKLGYDIQCARGRGNTGYYLNERCLTPDELNIISTGVESLSLLPDQKVKIYAKLSELTGLDRSTFDPVLYGLDEEDYEDDPLYSVFPSTKIKLENICRALYEGKQVTVYVIGAPSLTHYLLFEPSQAVQRDFANRENFGFFQVNPYRIFRNKNGELYFIFFVIVLQETCVGVMSIGEMMDARMCDSKSKSAKQVPAMLIDVDYLSFSNAVTYRSGETIRTCSFVATGQKGWGSGWLPTKDLAEDTTEENRNGQTVYTARYKLKNEDRLVGEFLLNNCYRLLPDYAPEYLDTFTVRGEQITIPRKAPTIYERIQEIHRNLRSNYEAPEQE